MTANESCQARVDGHMASRLRDLRHLWSEKHDEDGCACGEGSRYDYGLSFDYVSAGTFEGQREGYFRYQISTGGPGDEFRFFADAAGHLHRVEYWFLDWYDGARLTLTGTEYDTLSEVFEDFREVGAVDKAREEAEEP